MLKKLWQLFRTTNRTWGRCRASRMSAAMTYFTMLSLAPLLTFAIAIAGYILDSQQARDQIVEQVLFHSNQTVADIVSGLMQNVTRPNSGIIAGSISILILLYAASGVFSQLFDTFEEIWQRPIEKRSGFLFSLKKRGLGVMMVLIAGIMIVGSIVIRSALHYVSEAIAGAYPESLNWLKLADTGISWLGLPLILFLIFWLIPSRLIRWLDVVPAALLTSLLFGLNRYLILAYLKFSKTSEVYGAAGSLVVMLIWIYMTGLVLFYGAAFSRSWALTFGSLREEPGSADPENLDSAERDSDDSQSDDPQSDDPQSEVAQES